MAREFDTNFLNSSIYTSPPPNYDSELGELKAIIPLGRRTASQAWGTAMCIMIGGFMVSQMTSLILSLPIGPEWPMLVTFPLLLMVLTGVSGFILYRAYQKESVEKTQWLFAIYHDGLLLPSGRRINVNDVVAYEFFTADLHPHVQYSLTFECNSGPPCSFLLFSKRNYIGPIHDFNDQLKFEVALKLIPQALSAEGITLTDKLRFKATGFEYLVVNLFGKQSWNLLPFEQSRLDMLHGMLQIYDKSKRDPVAIWPVGVKNYHPMRVLIDQKYV